MQLPVDKRRRCAAGKVAGRLDIAVLGSEFGEEPRSTEAVAGDDVTLDCLPPRGQPAPRVRWTKDNHALKPDVDRVGVLESGSLRIRDVVRQDDGTYVCIAYNIGGQRDSSAATLAVRGANTRFTRARSESGSTKTSARHCRSFFCSCELPYCCL